MDAERARRQGLAGVFYALGAFGSWGIVVPLHFKLLGSVPAPLILAQRILWASLMTLGLIAFLRRLGELRKALSPNRSFVLLCLSAFLIGANWLVFIWAVNTGHLVQTSLGYFINPLVSVALGVLFLGERLRPLQIAACALAAGGVLLLTVAAGTLPWISLTLAFSFGVYGLIRKTVPVDPLIGFCVESLVLLPPAAAYLVVQGFSGGGSIFGDSAWVALLLVLTGVTTAAPLIWFAAAAQRLKLSTVGLLQYLAPSCTLLLGTLAYGEPFTRIDAVAFAAIWTALALYSGDALGLAWRSRVADQS
jgi:chloramphenicol-sensitive protein RarD